VSNRACALFLIGSIGYRSEVTNYTGCAKNGLFLKVNNFGMVNGRKACDMSKVSEFCQEKNRTSVVGHYNNSIV